MFRLCACEWEHKEWRKGSLPVLRTFTRGFQRTWYNRSISSLSMPSWKTPEVSTVAHSSLFLINSLKTSVKCIVILRSETSSDRWKCRLHYCDTSAERTSPANTQFLLLLLPRYAAGWGKAEAWCCLPQPANKTQVLLKSSAFAIYWPLQSVQLWIHLLTVVKLVFTAELFLTNTVMPSRYLPLAPCSVPVKHCAFPFEGGINSPVGLTP